VVPKLRETGDLELAKTNKYEIRVTSILCGLVSGRTLKHILDSVTSKEYLLLRIPFLRCDTIL
jgi:hypothetical protein